MAPRSKIETELSEADLAEFKRLLGTGRLTVDALTMWLSGHGYEISRSAVGRYAQNFEEVASKLRESRAMAETLVREIGPEATDGKQGRLLVEILRKLTMDVLIGQLNGDKDGELEPKELMALGRALKDMSQSVRLDQDFQDRVAAAAEAKAKAAAAETAASAAREGGATEDQVAFIRARILGIGQDQGDE